MGRSISFPAVSGFSFFGPPGPLQRRICITNTLLFPGFSRFIKFVSSDLLRFSSTRLSRAARRPYRHRGRLRSKSYIKNFNPAPQGLSLFANLRRGSRLSETWAETSIGVVNVTAENGLNQLWGSGGLFCT